MFNMKCELLYHCLYLLRHEASILEDRGTRKEGKKTVENRQIQDGWSGHSTTVEKRKRFFADPQQAIFMCTLHISHFAR